MSTPLRVLIVEDSPTDAKLVLHELRKMGRLVEWERVDTRVAMEEALDRREWDLVISDWSMPHFSALGALAVVKARQLDAPFLLVSGTVGEETAVEAMRAGADDFVLKDRLGRLVPAVERSLRECEDRRRRREVELALRASEVRFSRLAESGVIGIAIADVHGNLHDANDAFLKMIGYSREELVDGSVRWADLAPPESMAANERALAQLQASGIATPWETESFRKDGSRLSVLVGAAMLEHPTCIAFALDLSERKRAELEARSEVAKREQAEGALELSRDQLRQAQKMEAVGRLAGGVAHDFNNVLSVILSYGELILEGLPPADPIRPDIGEICKAATRATSLTRQLLTFSRQRVVETRVIDLHAVLEGMHGMMERILGEDVELVCVAPPTAGRVKADPSQIEQVILNLVVNSRDAMPTGGKLTIETSNITLDASYIEGHLAVTPGRYVMLAVSDTGAGMDRETQARIFEPFYTTKEVGKGTGLGLSTVFGIVQQSGGSIWVYSEPGKGTTFKIYLPRVDAEVDTVTRPPAPATLRGTETILLVEDEEQVRAIVLSVLSRQGYVVMPARDARDALLLSERHPGTIDLLLTDVVMPHMSGPVLAKHLAAARPRMKVLCMSGYTDDSIVRHGVLEAGVAFMQKPVTPSSLATKVREVLDSGAVTAASAAPIER